MRSGEAAHLSRSSGVLLHVTSLPVGRLGAEAYAFVDWLAAAGQTWWQVLPLGPPDEHRSPYKAAPAFPGSPALLPQPEGGAAPPAARGFPRPAPARVGARARAPARRAG